MDSSKLDTFRQVGKNNLSYRLVRQYEEDGTFLDTEAVVEEMEQNLTAVLQGTKESNDGTAIYCIHTDRAVQREQRLSDVLGGSGYGNAAPHWRTIGDALLPWRGASEPAYRWRRGHQRGVTIQAHRGWYRTVQVDSGATQANVAFGYIGAQATLAKGINVVTSADQALALGLNPCVFLGVVTPGNYTIVQDQGDATVYSTNAATKANTAAYTATHGQSADSGGLLSTIGTVGIVEATTSAAGLVRVALGFPFGLKAD